MLLPGRMPREAAVILTYRCPMACRMCHIHKYPTRPSAEIRPADLEKLPPLKFVNITGGEPFIREDLEDCVRVLYRKTSRIVISTSGWFSEKVIHLAEKFPRLGIRVSLEGLAAVNDELRGREGGFRRGLKVLLALRRLGLRDIGFGITISDTNAREMLRLYELSRRLKMEFATAAVHNSDYFHKHDNRIREREEVLACLEELIQRLLAEPHPKSWFRGYFNYGLQSYVRGEKRLLPCAAGTENFFVDPRGEVYPCNGFDDQCGFGSMGNLREAGNFRSLWFSPQAGEVRKKVADCPKNCWMIGTVAPVMKKKFYLPLAWVIRRKWGGLWKREGRR